MIVLIVSNICLFFINVPHFMSFHLCVHISVFCGLFIYRRCCCSSCAAAVDPHTSVILFVILNSLHFAFGLH